MRCTGEVVVKVSLRVVDARIAVLEAVESVEVVVLTGARSAGCSACGFGCSDRMDVRLVILGSGGHRCGNPGSGSR